MEGIISNNINVLHGTDITLKANLQRVIDEITTFLYDAHNTVSDILEKYTEYHELLGTTIDESDMENWEDYTVIDTIKVLHDEIDRLNEVFDHLPIEDPETLRELPQNIEALEREIGIEYSSEEEDTSYIKEPQEPLKRLRLNMSISDHDLDHYSELMEC